MLSNTWPMVIHLIDFKIIICKASYSIKFIPNIFVTKQELIIKQINCGGPLVET